MWALWPCICPIAPQGSRQLRRFSASLTKAPRSMLWNQRVRFVHWEMEAFALGRYGLKMIECYQMIDSKVMGGEVKKEGGFWEMLLGIFCFWPLVYIDKVWRAGALLSFNSGFWQNLIVTLAGWSLKFKKSTRRCRGITSQAPTTVTWSFTDAAMRIPFTAKPGVLLLSAPFRNHGPAAAFPKHSQGSEGGRFLRMCLHRRQY